MAVVVLGAIGGYLLRLASDPVYRSEVVVVASESKILADEFGDLAKTLISTDTVLAPVIQELGLPTTPEDLRRSGDLQAEAVPGAVAVRLIGRSTDPQLARSLARTAGETFARAAQFRGLGTFTVFGQGEATDQGPQSPAAWAVLGGALGVVLGLVGLLLLAFARRPILDAKQPAQELSPDAAFTLRLRRASGGRWRAYPAGALAGIAARILGSPKRGLIVIVLVERRRRGDHPLRWLASALRHILSASGQQIAILTVRGEIEALDATTPDVLPLADVVVAVVAAGAPSASLELLSEAASLLREDSQRIVVYAARMRGRARGPAPIVPIGEIPAVATGGREPAPQSRTREPASVPASPLPGEMPPPDVAPPDVAPPDVAPPDVAPPDVAPPDVAPPDVAPPDVAPPDVAPPDVAPPDVAADEAADVAVAERANPAPAAPTGGNEGRQAEETEALRGALDHHDPETRRAALDELLLRPEPSLIDAVRRQLVDPDPELRVLAVSVLAATSAARGVRPGSPRDRAGDATSG